MFAAGRSTRVAGVGRVVEIHRPQLPATTVQLNSTTRPTSAYQHQTSSGISTTRPTPATLVERPAANIYSAIIPATNITHLAEDHIQPPRTFTYTLVNTTNKLSLIIIVTSPLSLPIVLAVLIHIIHLRGRHTYRLRNTLTFFLYRSRRCLYKLQPSNLVSIITDWRMIFTVLSYLFHLLQSNISYLCPLCHKITNTPYSLDQFSFPHSQCAATKNPINTKKMKKNFRQTNFNAEKVRFDDHSIFLQTNEICTYILPTKLETTTINIWLNSMGSRLHSRA